jgi:hypothetical protein
MKLAMAGLAACAFLCSAQSAQEIFEKAPPDVDSALRARIGKFYQAHVDRKLRAADEVVAEDSKEAFFAIEKPNYRGWEIAAIKYSDDFTKAKVVVACEIDWANPRIGKVRVKQPVASLWKVENGQWFWYMEPVNSWNSPFGQMTPGPDPDRAAMRLDGFKGVKIEDVLAKVKIEPTGLQLIGYEPSKGEAVIRNEMPGEITLKLEYTGFPGLEVRLEKATLKSGETAKLLVSLDPVNKVPKPTTLVRIRVQPTEQILPLRVTFAVQPELQKQIPNLTQR